MLTKGGKARVLFSSACFFNFCSNPSSLFFSVKSNYRWVHILIYELGSRKREDKFG